jgi:hypothetical protein
MIKHMRGRPCTSCGTWVMGLVGLLSVLMPSAVVAGAVLTLNQINIERFPEISIYLTIADEQGAPLKGLDASHIVVQEDGSTVGCSESGQGFHPGDERDRPGGGRQL